MPLNRRLMLALTPLAGLLVLQREPLADARGTFERLFCDDELGEWLGGRQVRQINHTTTGVASTVRGLHYQSVPNAEAKVVTCLRGRVFDVAVDLRADSPTFLQWHGVVLSEDNYRSLLIPEGFAHGFQALVDDCHLLYLHTASHAPGSEGGLHPEDPRVGVRWPLTVGGLSPRDAGRPWLSPSFTGLQL